MSKKETGETARSGPEREENNAMFLYHTIYRLCRHGGPVYAWSIQRDVTRRVRVLPVGPHILGWSLLSSSLSSSSTLLRPLVWTYVSLKRVVLCRRREFRAPLPIRPALIHFPSSLLSFLFLLSELAYFSLSSISFILLYRWFLQIAAILQLHLKCTSTEMLSLSLSLSWFSLFCDKLYQICLTTSTKRKEKNPFFINIFQF